MQDSATASQCRNLETAKMPWVCKGDIEVGCWKLSRKGISDPMDHLAVFRDKIGRLRVEITDIQVLNQKFRRDGGNGTGSQLAHGQRSERLQSIQHELVQIADLGRRVVLQNK